LQREDLEFSVGSKATVWEVKDPLLNSAPMDPSEEDIRSTYNAGGGAASLVGGVSGSQMYGGARRYPPSAGY
jgi:hypothetical protein